MNPWFRDADDPNIAGLDGWTRVLTNGVGWGLSQKESNPAPDIVVSGVCDLDQVYCGTAARWAEQNGVTYPNIDVYLYQIVAANEAQRRLTFFTHWVSHRVDVAEVTILGSDTPDGPWTQVWVPFSHYQDEVIVPPGGGQEELWEDTGFLEKTIDRGYRYYRIELRSRLPQGDGVGFKITGLYFSTEADGGPVEPHSYVYLPLFRFR